MNPFITVVAKKRAAGGGGGGGGIFYRPLTIDNTKVPSTQVNFPVLVSLSNATFKTIANGGNVARSDGFDIGFYSDESRSTKLQWEMESYNGSTGTIVAHVKMVTLSSSPGDVFYMEYGDSAITTDQSDPVNVWSNSFVSVYHLGNGTTLSVADSRAANNGTNNGATAATGQVDGGAGFVSASSQYIALGSGAFPTTPVSGLTYSAWVKATSLPNAFNAVIVRTNSTLFSGVWIKSDGHAAPFFNQTSGTITFTGTAVLSTGTWYHVVVTFSAGVLGLNGYVNGALDGTQAPGDPGGLNDTAMASRIGGDSSTASAYWNGSIDEVRIASVARSANWITTEYNNQSSPSTFITMGSETAG